MNPTDYVKWRLTNMYSMPEMWAATKESFGMQLCLLVEVYELNKTEPWSKTPTSSVLREVFGPGSVVPKDEIDTIWAQDAVRAVAKLLGFPPTL